MGRVVDLMREAGGMQIMQDLVAHGVAFGVTEREISQERVLNREATRPDFGFKID